jgi:hypothetical protein
MHLKQAGFSSARKLKRPTGEQPLLQVVYEFLSWLSGVICKNLPLIRAADFLQ